MSNQQDVFGGRLRKLREAASLTQTDLGNLLGSGKVQVSRYETGGVLPNAATLVRVADHFNCSVDYLLGRTDKISGMGRENDEFSPEERFIVEALRERRYSRLMNLIALRFEAEEDMRVRALAEREALNRYEEDVRVRASAEHGVLYGFDEDKWNQYMAQDGRSNHNVANSGQREISRESEIRGRKLEKHLRAAYKLKGRAPTEGIESNDDKADVVDVSQFDPDDQSGIES